MAEIALYNREVINSVSKVIGKLLENETDYDHLKPLLDTWTTIHDSYSDVWFPDTDLVTKHDVLTCVEFLDHVDELEYSEYVKRTIIQSVNPKHGHTPLPQFTIDDHTETRQLIRNEEFPDENE